MVDRGSWPAAFAGPLGGLQLIQTLSESLTVFLAFEGPRLEMDPRHRKCLLVQSQEGCPWSRRQLEKTHPSPGLLAIPFLVRLDWSECS